MPRITPTDRHSKLLGAAAATFVEHGYQRTQMDDVAKRIGVSKGTIYRAVNSKEALFAAVIAWADTPDEVPSAGIAAVGDVGSVAASLLAELRAIVSDLELTAIATGRQPDGRSGEIGEEIERITAELHRLLRSRRTAIMVLDRCAVEIPELAALWFGEGRYALVDLWQEYLTVRADHVDTSVDPALVARTIVEVITVWAVKMPWDPEPRNYPDDTAPACGTMVRHLVIGGAR